MNQITTNTTDETSFAPRESHYACGEKFLIEYNVVHGCRSDGKRIFYHNSTEPTLCVYRCRSCHQPVDETVPGAEVEEAASVNALIAIRGDGFVDGASFTNKGPKPKPVKISVC